MEKSEIHLGKKIHSSYPDTFDPLTDGVNYSPENNKSRLIKGQVFVYLRHKHPSSFTQ